MARLRHGRMCDDSGGRAPGCFPLCRLGAPKRVGYLLGRGTWPVRTGPLGKADYSFAALVVLAYLPVALFAIGHHEMWRDELHCWLVARDSATPWAVVGQRAYDGQPPLWYLLLWFLEKITHHPPTIHALHVPTPPSLV